MSTVAAPDVVHGHLGHLTQSQESALTTFKANLVQAQLITLDPPSHDDPTLLRFLRARKWDPSAAQKQFADTQAWRQKYDVDVLYKTFDPVEFEQSRRFYPRWTGRRDRQGLPVYVYRLASLVPIQKELEAVSVERRYLRIVALYETMVNVVSPLCTYLPHPSSPTPVTTVTTLIDLEGVGATTMWGLRKHLQQASVLATANYPETLSATIVVNAPSFFPTVWGWVKAWFDEGTRNKVHVLGKDHTAHETLRALIHPKDLPKIYGGELEWKFEDEPSLDEETAAALGGSMPKGPSWFRDGKVVLPTPQVP